MAGDTYIPEQEMPGMGPHDIGGIGPYERIDTTDHGMNHWEVHANALRMAVTRYTNLGTLDEMRRAAEEFGERFYQIGYFERQTEALAIVLKERGMFNDRQIQYRMEEIELRFSAVPKISLPEPPESHGHEHDHGEDQPHEYWKEDEKGEGPDRHHLMNLAIQELLQERGVLKADEVRYMIEKFDGDFPNRGPQVIARAWTDPNFKSRLLNDAGPAISELGIDLEYQARIIALENTRDIHNVVVCTLCSCYPRFLMGQPPTWYKSRSYRSRTIFEPRAVLREFGTELPADTAIRVHDSNADMRYIVVPIRPEGTEGWSEERLSEIITRDNLVGVSLPNPEFDLISNSG